MFEAEDVTCIRGETRVFAGVSFALDAGEGLLITGANGSGKSSLLRLCAGLSRPAAGALRWSGGDISAAPETHLARVHYVGHADALKPELSAAENLHALAAIAGGAAKGTMDKARIGRILERFAIAHLADSATRFLSAGQRRRLTLARLLAVERPLWLLDEPTTALDAAGSDLVAALIDEHRAAGGLAVVSGHGPPGGRAMKVLALETAP